MRTWTQGTGERGHRHPTAEGTGRGWRTWGGPRRGGGGELGAVGRGSRRTSQPRLPAQSAVAAPGRTQMNAPTLARPSPRTLVARSPAPTSLSPGPQQALTPRFQVTPPLRPPLARLALSWLLLVTTEREEPQGHWKPPSPLGPSPRSVRTGVTQLGLAGRGLLLLALGL